MALPKKRKKHRIRNLYIGVGIAALFLLGIGGWILLQKTPKDGNEPEVNILEENSELITYKGKQYEYNEHLSHFLFLGIDKEEQQETNVGSGQAGQADTIFLLSMDRIQKTMLLLAIPRDTMTEIQVYGPQGNSLGSTVDHLNLAYGYGDGGRESCILMKEAVSNLLYGIPIQKYCSVTMDVMKVLADSVGGVSVTISDESLEQVNPSWTKGSQVELTGDTVEQFLRSRDIKESQSALGRLQRQQEFLQAYGKKVKEIYEKNSSLPVQLYDNIKPYMVTNIGKDQFVQMMTDFSSEKEVESRMLPGNGTTENGYDEYHVDEDALYEFILEQYYVERKEE